MWLLAPALSTALGGLALTAVEETGLAGYRYLRTKAFHELKVGRPMANGFLKLFLQMFLQEGVSLLPMISEHP